MRRFGLVFVLAMAAVLTIPAGVLAGDSQVPGHQSSKYDEDGNGIPDEGVVVTGKYTQTIEWEDGDCVYQVHYRGSFENTAYQDTGWILNNIRCTDETGTSTYNYLMVNESDPRYTGNPDWALWNNWEYHVLTESGSGNQVEKIRPETHVGG